MCTVPLLPYSLPRDPYDCALRAPLRMTKVNTVPFCFTMLFVSAGIADLPTAARRSLPPWSRLTPPDDETKHRYALFAGGRGRPPLPRSTESKFGRSRPARAGYAPRGGSSSGGRGRPRPFKAFPLGGRWIAEAIAKARRMRGRAMTNAT